MLHIKLSTSATFIYFLSQKVIKQRIVISNQE